MSHRCALLLLPALLGLAGAAGAQHLIPAGTLVHCRTGEKISSQKLDTGDPVVCSVTRSREFAFGSELTGAFEDYKDPGHLIGKGWMELRFGRLLLPHTQLPLDAKVVDASGYVVDKQGRILGKGHAVRDVFAWMVPILWPIDLLELGRRGPRPTLKPETELMVKLMSDVVVPQAEARDELNGDQYGFRERTVSQAMPIEYVEPAPAAYYPSPPPPPVYYQSRPAPAYFLPPAWQTDVFRMPYRRPLRYHR